MKHTIKLLESIYTQLNTLSYSVSNNPLDDSNYPFVVIDTPINSQDNCKTEYFERTIITINVLSKYDGSKEVLEILGEIQEVLADLTVVDCRVATQRITNESIINNGEVRIATIQYEFKLI